MKLKSIDLITINSSGSKRVFLTVEDKGKTYEHFIDCPLNMIETPEEYVNANLSKIEKEILPQSEVNLDSFTRDYKHPKGIKKLKEIESARNMEEKVDLIIELLKEQL